MYQRLRLSNMREHPGREPNTWIIRVTVRVRVRVWVGVVGVTSGSREADVLIHLVGVIIRR